MGALLSKPIVIDGTKLKLSEKNGSDTSSLLKEKSDIDGVSTDSVESVHSGYEYTQYQLKRKGNIFRKKNEWVFAPKRGDGQEVYTVRRQTVKEEDGTYKNHYVLYGASKEDPIATIKGRGQVTYVNKDGTSWVTNWKPGNITDRAPHWVAHTRRQWEQLTSKEGQAYKGKALYQRIPKRRFFPSGKIASIELQSNNDEKNPFAHRETVMAGVICTNLYGF